MGIYSQFLTFLDDPVSFRVNLLTYPADRSVVRLLEPSVLTSGLYSRSEVSALGPYSGA